MTRLQSPKSFGVAEATQPAISSSIGGTRRRFPLKDLFESSEVTLESIESITKEPKAQGLMLIGRNSGVDGTATLEPLTLWQLDERYFGRMRTPCRG